jgi:choline-glycine betaine transporter
MYIKGVTMNYIYILTGVLFSVYIIYIAYKKYSELNKLSDEENKRKVKLAKFTLMLVATIGLANIIFIFSHLIKIYNYAPLVAMGV